MYTRICFIKEWLKKKLVCNLKPKIFTFLSTFSNITKLYQKILLRELNIILQYIGIFFRLIECSEEDLLKKQQQSKQLHTRKYNKILSNTRWHILHSIETGILYSLFDSWLCNLITNRYKARILFYWQSLKLHTSAMKFL